MNIVFNMLTICLIDVHIIVDPHYHIQSGKKIKPSYTDIGYICILIRIIY